MKNLYNKEYGYRIQSNSKFNPNDRTQRKYYASANTTGDVTTEALCKEAEQISTVNGADFHASLYVLVEMMAPHLAKGKNVRVEHLGSFRLAISSEGKDTAKEVSSHSMNDVRIIFTPSAKLSAVLKTLEYKKIP